MLYLSIYGWLRWNGTFLHYHHVESGHSIEIDRGFGIGGRLSAVLTAGPTELEAAENRINRRKLLYETSFWPLRQAEALVHAITRRGE